MPHRVPKLRLFGDTKSIFWKDKYEVIFFGQIVAVDGLAGDKRRVLCHPHLLIQLQNRGAGLLHLLSQRMLFTMKTIEMQEVAIAQQATKHHQATDPEDSIGLA